MKTEYIVEFSRKSFYDEVSSRKEPIIVDFYASWCSPCAAMKPVFLSLAEHFHGKVFFGIVNIDELRDIAIEYSVSSIPMFIIILEKKVVWSHTGTISEEKFKGAIERVCLQK